MVVMVAAMDKGAPALAVVDMAEATVALAADTVTVDARRLAPSQKSPSAQTLGLFLWAVDT